MIYYPLKKRIFLHQFSGAEKHRDGLNDSRQLSETKEGTK